MGKLFSCWFGALAVLMASILFAALLDFIPAVHDWPLLRPIVFWISLALLILSVSAGIFMTIRGGHVFPELWVISVLGLLAGSAGLGGNLRSVTVGALVLVGVVGFSWGLIAAYSAVLDLGEKRGWRRPGFIGPFLRALAGVLRVAIGLGCLSFAAYALYYTTLFLLEGGIAVAVLTVILGLTLVAVGLLLLKPVPGWLKRFRA